jgi:hypothetical protein
MIDTPGLTVIKAGDFGGNFDAYQHDVDQLRGRGRVWLVITHAGSSIGDEEDTLLALPFSRLGRELDHATAFGAQAILFDL